MCIDSEERSRGEHNPLQSHAEVVERATFNFICMCVCVSVCVCVCSVD